MSRGHIISFLLLISLLSCNDNLETQNPDSTTMSDKSINKDLLPSWKDGKVKSAIVGFVNKVSDSTGDNYVAVGDRIAVFDNDGTLWVEKPVYSQFIFLMDRIKDLAPHHPEWKQKPHFQVVMEGNMDEIKKLGHIELLELLMSTHSGMTTEAFKGLVKEWIDTASHPVLKKPYTQCIYKPMIELIEYLKDHNFNVYIVSGGGVEFMRSWSEKVYGIPPERIIGSSIKTRYAIQEGKPVLIRQPELHFIDDKEGKPAGINEYIGKRPIAAFGNSDGDFQMLEWVTSGSSPSLGMIIHHDDEEREFRYDRDTPIGHLEKGIQEAESRGWFLVSMKNDWKEIFCY